MDLILWLPYGCEIRSIANGNRALTRAPVRTCRRLSEICAPVLFRSVCIEEVDPERHHHLAKSVQKLGRFFHALTLSLEDGLTNGEDLPIYSMLPHMPNVRSLTVVHEREDCAPHTALQQATDKFTQLEDVTIHERNYDEGFDHLPTPRVETTTTFFHHFLRTILETHASHIKSLHLYTLLPLHCSIYIKMRDETPNLQLVTFAGVIDEALEDEFEAPIPWASGKTGSLKGLTFLNCHLHYGRFARNVLLGVYGTRLERATLMACGTRDDNILDVPPTSTPVHGSIDSLRLNHFDPWELSTVSIIPVRDLSLTRAHPMAFVELPTLLKGLPDTGSSHVGFRGLERLRMSQKLSFEHTWRLREEGTRQAYEELKTACVERGIELSLDAVESTSSHDRICAYVG